MRRSADHWNTVAAMTGGWSRLGIRLTAAAIDRSTSSPLILALIGIHVVAWTIIFTVVRTGQGPNEDSMEAYAWGRQLLLGYGKHPPLSGWIARIWFSVFPTADWAMYALAMATVGCAVCLCWALSLQVVERRRAVLVALSLLIYPIFNIRGSRFTPDLLQAPLFVLVVLCFLIAFRRRTLGWAIVLGLVCAFAVLAKYWALLIVGAIGVAALAHPDRVAFFRSPIPYLSAVVFLIALTPHLIWLVQSDYAPLEHAVTHRIPRSYSPLAQAGSALRHHFGMLLPVGLALAWAIGRSRVQVPVSWPTVRVSEARHIWAIVVVLALVPPIAAVLSGVYLATDWGVPLYSLVPLAVLAIPSLGVPLRALGRVAGLWIVFVGAGVLLSPAIRVIETKLKPARYLVNEPDLAERVTQLWRERHQTPLPVVAAGRKRFAAAISFYSPDHPLIFTGFNPRIATWIDRDALARSGFVAVCAEGHRQCDAAALAIRPSMERALVTPKPNRFAASARSPSFTVFMAPPRRLSF